MSSHKPTSPVDRMQEEETLIHDANRGIVEPAPGVPLPRHRVYHKFSTNTVEDEVFEVVRAAAQEMAAATGDPIVEIRVAGGWCRDKLLGTESDDIDFVFSSVSGLTFAGYVNKVLAASGEPTTDLGSHAVRNAEQSAHLETVCIGIAGLEIDMNQLRRERYDPGSRIPEITIGTLFDDAERRDFTINALFYEFGATQADDNIVDPTGKAMRDLIDGVVRTNIDPVQSFTDDPLRMLRAVRYVTRYGFRMDPSVRVVFDDANVRQQFRHLVSRQLTMRELFKMFHQEERADSLKLLAEVGKNVPLASSDNMPGSIVRNGSFLDDVVPIRYLLRDTVNIPLEDSFNADVVPMTVDFLASWAALGRDDPSDVKYWGLALDLSPTGFYVAASLHPHLIKLPPPALPLFREITPDSKPTQQQLRKNEKQYFARLRKLDTFLNTYLPSSTTRDSRLLRHATRGAITLAALLEQVFKDFPDVGSPSRSLAKFASFKFAIATWLQEYLSVDFNDCDISAEEVLSLRIVAAPTVHATHVPWRAVLLMAIIINIGPGHPKLVLQWFKKLESIIEAERLAEIAAALPVLNGKEVKKHLSEVMRQELRAGPIIGVLMRKVFEFQVRHSIKLADSQPEPTKTGTQNQLVFTESVTLGDCLDFLQRDDEVQVELIKAAELAQKQGRSGKKTKTKKANKKA